MAMAGCCPTVKSSYPHADRSRNASHNRNAANSVSIRLALRDEEAFGRVEGLLQTVDALEPTVGIHYTRFAILDSKKWGGDGTTYLLFAAIYDGARLHRVVDLLVENADRLEALFLQCRDYVPGTLADPKKTQTLLDSHKRELRNLLWYPAYRGKERDIHAWLNLRDDFLCFIRDVMPAPDLDVRFRQFIARHQDIALRAGGVRLGTAQPPPTRLERRGEFTHPFNMVVPIARPCGFKAKLRVWRAPAASSCVPQLEPLDTLHYARIAVFERDKMLFGSVYDGDWFQYIEDFRNRVGVYIDMMFGNGVDYPTVKNVWKFKAYLERASIPTHDFYASYMNRTVKEIKAAARLRDGIAGFARVHKHMGSKRLRHHLEGMIGLHQEALS